MPTSVELREQRANIWSQMQEIMDRSTTEKRPMSQAESDSYDKWEKELDDLGALVARMESHEKRQKEFSGPVDRSQVVQPVDGARPGRVVDSAEYKSAFMSYVRGGVLDMAPERRAVLQRGFVSDPSIQNALGVGTSSAGGYTVPLEFRNTLIETMKWFGSMRSVAEHFTTDSGVNLPWPTVDDTSNVGAILSENTQASQQDVTFGTNSLDAYMYTSKIVLVSFQLLNDAGFAIDTWLPKALGRRIGRIQNQHFTTGTGTAQPDGLVTSGTVGKQGTTGQTATVIYDDLIDLIDSLDPYYLGSPNVQWMLGQPIRKVVRKIKDSQNRPLWEPSLQVGAPDSLLGYGISLNNDMPAPAASAKTIAFGDFEQGYVIRDVNDVQVLRLTERYADYLQVGFLAFQRSDGTAQNTAAYRLYQHSAT